MDAAEWATYCSSNKRGTDAGTIETTATEVNLSRLPITFPLNKTDHNLSLSLPLDSMQSWLLSHRAARVGDKWSERVYVCV